MAGEGVIAVHAASKTFGARRALDGVALAVGRGEMIGLIGPSGAGKSTLLRAINGLVVLDAGEGTIKAFGQSVQRDGRVSERVRQLRARIGMVFQQFNLVGRLSLYTNVALGMLGRISFWRGLFGLWPAEDLSSAFFAALERAISEEADPQKRSSLERVLIAARTVGNMTLSAVIANAVGIGRSHLGLG